jgi:hypothetical protein
MDRVYGQVVLLCFGDGYGQGLSSNNGYNNCLREHFMPNNALDLIVVLFERVRIGNSRVSWTGKQQVTNLCSVMFPGTYSFWYFSFRICDLSKKLRNLCWIEYAGSKWAYIVINWLWGTKNSMMLELHHFLLLFWAN